MNIDEDSDKVCNRHDNWFKQMHKFTAFRVIINNEMRSKIDSHTDRSTSKTRQKKWKVL